MKSGFLRIAIARIAPGVRAMSSLFRGAYVQSRPLIFYQGCYRFMTSIAQTPSGKLPPPMRVGEILDRSFRLVVPLTKSIFPALLFLASLHTFSLYMRADLNYFAWLLGEIIGWLGDYYIGLLVTILAADVWLEREPAFPRAAQKLTIGLIFRSFVCSMQFAFMTAFFTFLFIIPGIIYACNRILAMTILLVENVQVPRAMKWSKRLMKRGRWYSFKSPAMRVTGVLLVNFLAVGFLVTLDSGRLAAEDVLGVQTMSWVIVTTLSGVLARVGTAFSALSLVGFYYDLRSRYEGADLLEAAARVRNAPTGGGGATAP